MQPQTQQARVAALAVDDVTARVYTLRTNGHEVLVDAGNKGKPGDTVVLWPKKKAPVVCRKLARVAPYPGESAGPAALSDRFYFADLRSGHMFNMSLNRVAAIHKVVDVLSRGAS